LHNLSVVKKYAPQAKVVTMVKANAYGHHLNLVTPLLLLISVICEL
jgi:alanine racemase